LARDLAGKAKADLVIGCMDLLVALMILG
jgi:hypothetical protein